MAGPFTAYFNAIKSLDAAEATEHTLRGALETLLNAIAADARLNVRVIHEPKRDKTKLGAPDFKIKLNEATLGYLETKSIGDNLDAVLQSAQIAKYKRLSGNLILTDYLEWLWLRDGKIIKRETLCYPSDAGNRKARLDSDKAEKVVKLIAGFLSVPPAKLGNTNTLSRALAVRCHDLRDFLLEELERQEKEHREGPLYGLYEVFQKEVFQGLMLKEFADAFAQTLGYGLFLAKLNAGETTTITLRNAKQHISTNFALLRELVNFLDELDQDEYRGIRWLVEEILSIMNTLDLTAIREDLSFSKRLSQPSLTTDERELFAKDPYIYFYEDFLRAYDKDMSQRRGVYYTPPPVVSFIVRAVNDLLKDTFGISSGLADRKRVTVLDFATGTGTFLLEVLQQIFEAVPESVRNQVVQEHVLKNLYGFEYLIAPYTVAHLKLSQFLHDKGYVMQPDERLNIYLTNTLEPIEPQRHLLLPALSREVEAAQAIKDKPVLVITGNPPYSGHSKNTGKWITELIDTYKKVDGKPLGEKNSKWLQDDYVKFIRFAQWKMEQAEEGVVGIITNHSFLDNPTFRGMRYSLMQTFHQIYVLDLHGNTRKKERMPEGGRDENVFDIEQGVAISLFIKKPGLSPAVYHADLWGKRNEKYWTLLETEKDSVKWQKLQPSLTPFFLFIPYDRTRWPEYEKGWQVTEIFPVKALGFQTHRDHFAIAYEKSDIERRVREMRDESITDQSLQEKYQIRDNRDWKVAKSRITLQGERGWDKNIISCAYRPFDNRFCYFGYATMDYPKKPIMDHVFNRRNVALLCSRQVRDSEWRHTGITEIVPESCLISDKTKEQNHVFPLYRYRPPEGQGKGNLFADADPFQGKERIENLSPKFRAFIDAKYKHHTALKKSWAISTPYSTTRPIEKHIWTS